MTRPQLDNLHRGQAVKKAIFGRVFRLPKVKTKVLGIGRTPTPFGKIPKKNLFLGGAPPIIFFDIPSSHLLNLLAVGAVTSPSVSSSSAWADLFWPGTEV